MTLLNSILFIIRSSNKVSITSLYCQHIKVNYPLFVLDEELNVFKLKNSSFSHI